MIARRYSDLALFRRLLAEARAYRPHMVAILVLSLLSTPLALLTPVPLKIAVDYVLDGKPLPSFANALVPEAIAHSPSALLTLAVVLLLAIALLQNIEGFGSWLLQLYTGEKLVLDFRTRVFQHVQRLSLLYHDLRGTADSLYRIQFDAPAVQYLTIQGVIPFLTSGLTVIAMIIVTARIDWTLAVVALVVIPILLLASQLYRRWARAAWAEVKVRESTAMSVVQEVLGAVRVVKAFGQETRESRRFREHANRSLRAQLRAVYMETGFGILVAMVIAGGTAAVLYFGVRHAQAGTLSLGNLLVVMAYLAQLYRPLETLSKNVGTIQSSFASAERSFALLDELTDVPEPQVARSLRTARGAIALDRVSFSYEGGADVLRDVSIEVPPGTCVGISGPTGAGKTTLVSLLPRFYDPTVGRVLLDGVDLREYRVSDLRNQFAIVLQEPVLFSASIAENIAYGLPGAAEAEIIAAARAANAHDFIERLPDGYGSAVGERGMRLSGGERQRISLARAFLRNAPVLILDEPTSSVDTASEMEIMDAMERLMQNRTTFMIAHRLATLKKCDVRLHVEAGRVRVLAADELSEAESRAPGIRRW